MTHDAAQTAQPLPSLREVMAEQQALDQLLSFGAQPGLKPHELNQQQRKARVLLALKQHGQLTVACTATGIPRRTVYDWRESDPEFEDLVSQWLYHDMETEIVDSMFELATKGASDPKRANAAVRAGEVLLKSINRPRYGDQLQLDQTLTINHNVQQLDAFMDRQRQAIQQLERTASPIIDAEFQALPAPSETEEDQT